MRIILSGYTDAEDIIAGVNEGGIWQYLLKPWQPEQLLLILSRAAEVWQLQQDSQRLSLDLAPASSRGRRACSGWTASSAPRAARSTQSATWSRASPPTTSR